MRADAQRNRQKILQTSQVVFAERGLEVSLDEIAARAGLGIGTVYRRFANKEELIDDLFELRIDSLIDRAAECLSDQDAWEGLVRFIETLCQTMSSDRGVRDILQTNNFGRTRVARSRERLIAATAALVVRARESGQLRPDFDEEDFPIVILMLETVASYIGKLGPDLWRRYLDLLLDALRTDAVPARSLGRRPLTNAEIETARSTWQPPRRQVQQG